MKERERRGEINDRRPGFPGEAGDGEGDIGPVKEGKAFRRVSADLLARLQEPAASTLATWNIYFHPNPLLRWVFWERLRAAASLCAEIPSREVLDVGCGGGELLPSLAARFSRVVGVDLNATHARKLVDHLRLGNVEVEEGDFLTLPFEESSFGLAVAGDVLKHQQDLPAFVARIARVLKPEGRLVACLPNENFFYRLGRFVFGIRPPADHYHRAGEIFRVVETRFRIGRVRSVPFVFFPLFRVIQCDKR